MPRGCESERSSVSELGRTRSKSSGSFSRRACPARSMDQAQRTQTSSWYHAKVIFLDQLFENPSLRGDGRHQEVFEPCNSGTRAQRLCRRVFANRLTFGPLPVAKAVTVVRVVLTRTMDKLISRTNTSCETVSPSQVSNLRI